ncbi:MAG: hypothetical protein ACOY46_00235 [Bacillota bacterium]
MTKWKIALYILLFLGPLAFSLGVFFLFFISVPVEAVLKRLEFYQHIIDIIMKIIIFLWALSSIVLTYVFYRGIILDRVFRSVAGFVTSLLLIASLGVFSLLISTDNPLMASIKSEAVEYKNGYTFGPYPEEQQLRQMKKEGYNGVITLLSPTIPFENILLEREIETGRKIGLEIHSFPMLPWVSDNRSSIEGIKEFVANNRGKYYVHCNLGKHRANLVKQLIDGTAGVDILGKELPLKKKLERGELKYYQANRIILGPLPTDEEWLSLIARGIKEVVCFLDPGKEGEADIIRKARDACDDLGVAFTLKPIKWNGNKYTGTDDLLNYVNNSNTTIYIHGFNMDDSRLLLIESNLVK